MANSLTSSRLTVGSGYITNIANLSTTSVSTGPDLILGSRSVTVKATQIREVPDPNYVWSYTLATPNIGGISSSFYAVNDSDSSWGGTIRITLPATGRYLVRTYKRERDYNINESADTQTFTFNSLTPVASGGTSYTAVVGRDPSYSDDSHVGGALAVAVYRIS